MDMWQQTTRTAECNREGHCLADLVTTQPDRYNLIRNANKT